MENDLLEYRSRKGATRDFNMAPMGHCKTTIVANDVFNMTEAKAQLAHIF